MLYNKDWDKPKGVNTIRGLIAWLETKDPSEMYDYTSPHQCMCAQYYRAHGYWFVQASSNHIRHGIAEYTPLPHGFNAIAAMSPHTFGDALERARIMEQTGHMRA